MEDTYYAGAYEELLPAPGSEYASIEQTRVTDAVRHVRTTAVKTANGKKTTVTSSYVDYLHKDHLGSVEGATNADGARTRTLAYDPYGGRRKADWTAALPKSEVAALENSSDPRTRGHTGHEHLDRTGLIHRGGRVYDPTLGRFLSPDPLVGNPGSAQSWNGYSYVSNSPMSFVDPSGLSQRPVGCGVGGLRCRGQGGGVSGGGLGLASVVSTHRFQWVDIFFSVVSSWFDPGWGVPISTPPFNPNPRYSWGGGVGDGGWGYDSPAPFHFGVAHYSVTFQVTSQIGVGGIVNITGRDVSIENETASSQNGKLEDVTKHKDFPAYRTRKGTIIQLNSAKYTKLPTGATLDALITFVDESGLETVVISGGSERLKHSDQSFHYKNLAIDVAGPSFNELTNETVRSAANKAGFTHVIFEDRPGTNSDHWHLQIGAGNGLDDRHRTTNPEIVTRTY